APPSSRRNPSAVDRIRKRDEVEPLGGRFSFCDRHLSGDRPTIHNLNFFIRENRCYSDQEPTTQEYNSRAHRSSRRNYDDKSERNTSAIVPKEPCKEKGGSLWASPSLFLPPWAEQGARSYLPATGMICAGCSTAALFIPAADPCNGSNRWSP